MNSLIQRIDKIIEEQSLLKHKFYVMWNEGKLSIDSLNGYSREYLQLVKSVPLFVDKIMTNSPGELKDAIALNRDEESEHIAPWMNFAQSLGVHQNDLSTYEGLDLTKQAVSNLSSLMNSFEGGAAAMYALEQEIPKISLTKIDGLRKFYGISDDRAIEYFRLHAEADIRHAALWRQVLEKTPASREDELVQIAIKSMAAQNMLLDSCYNAYC
ncbi:TENA/THI-4 domain protein [Nitrosotalea sinensis]|uniref:TENA/THI-4 domain protein n=1 Tax=Nitrosotalea sinensis TaxID=1499975 RepID=A0A2H1EG00_9ARCH|nr:iron-containing redox enzyme family protein [Candidatus Nitrosotalea sinensis]SHO44515.1 TENA/THI-4 domain protein [Candidatus Nitrosotalea sinensis]